MPMTSMKKVLVTLVAIITLFSVVMFILWKTSTKSHIGIGDSVFIAGGVLSVVSTLAFVARHGIHPSVQPSHTINAGNVTSPFAPSGEDMHSTRGREDVITSHALAPAIDTH